MNLKPKPPKKINSAVKKLVKELGISDRKPKYLKYIHKNNNYKLGYCFNNCENEISVNGGEAVYGWLIWESKKQQFIEAEFHCVLKENGELIDITPCDSIIETEVLFIEDTSRDSGRMDSENWYSWSNLKMINGNVVEESRKLRVEEIDAINSKLHYI
ncbi:hypothetical protein [Pseudoalteromonas sp.]|uniref:hypothetical protein n=1 Tax=Pseudoalteromonas sp. TaxID=53249 RepID=UPI002355DD72|nr:hypothetical protein [Pseudoalteromonas sp.]